MAAAGNAFQLLNVTSTSTRQQIEARYRSSARAVHPDKGGTHDDMVQLTNAKDRLLAPGGLQQELRRTMPMPHGTCVRLAGMLEQEHFNGCHGIALD